MTIAKLAPSLILSRLGEMTASFLFLAFIGNLLPKFMAQASFAWAFISFVTVMGIGLFSIILIETAAIGSANTERLANLFSAGIQLALTCGTAIVIIVLTYIIISNGSVQQSPTSLQALLTISLATPALYCQIVAFNFYNAQGKTKYELIYSWSINAIFIIATLIFMHYKPTVTIIDFIIAYVTMRWLGAGLIIFMIVHFELRNYRLLHLNNGAAPNQLKLFLSGVPLALCFGGESFLYFALSLISKHLGDEELSTYQISIHFLSIVYMISIGVGNAATILIAGSDKKNHAITSRSTLAEASIFGGLLMTPCILICLFFPYQVALLYTADRQVAIMAAEVIQLSIPFLIFELFYVLTRMVLRSLGDSWVPTALTLTCLNGGGLFFTWLIFNIYQPSIKSIIIALTGCTFILMISLLTRFFNITRPSQRGLFYQ